MLLPTPGGPDMTTSVDEADPGFTAESTAFTVGKGIGFESEYPPPSWRVSFMASSEQKKNTVKESHCSQDWQCHPESKGPSTWCNNVQC